MTDEKEPVLGPARMFYGPVDEPINGEWREVGLGGPIEPEGIVPRSWIESAIDAATTDQTITVTTKLDTSRFDQMLDVMRNAIGGMEQFTRAARSVALMGTGYRRHASPGKRRDGETRASHARRRRLYTERLRRDRRRVREGRAPILRSSAFQALIPRAQLDVRKAGPEALGMEIVLSTAVPDDQVYVVDNSVLDQFVQPYELTPPKLFDTDAGAWKRELLYGLDRALLGRPHKATNYIIQADAVARQDAGIQGYTSPGFWVDETAGWAPEHGSDEDRWINEGGADRG